MEKWMNHLEEGALQAWLDGELDGDVRPEVEAHLEACFPCRERVGELRDRAGRVTGALALTDRSPSRSTEEARWAVRREWARRRSGARRQLLGRAAAILLLASGILAASVPGSPLRAWMAEGWMRVAQVVGTDRADRDGAALADAAEEVPAPEAPPEARRVGIGAGPSGLEIVLTEVPVGTEVRVEVVDGDRGAVEVWGEASFRTATGRLEARILEGPVRVALPRDADGRLVVDGRLLARSEAGGTLTPVVEPLDTAGGVHRFRMR